jgi:hypothetical protein
MLEFYHFFPIKKKRGGWTDNFFKNIISKISNQLSLKKTE